jgi:glycosyl transferase, family 25
MTKFKTFVVSLLSCTERRLYIGRHLQELHIPFEFIDAVNGRELVLNEDKRIDYKAIQEKPWLTPNLIGCALSHINIYQKIVDENLDYAFVLEDDIYLEKNISGIISEIEKVIQKDQIIMLHYRCWEPIDLYKKDGQQLLDNYYLFDATAKYNLLSTAAYFITNGAAKSMLKKLLPIHTGPDQWNYFCESGALKNLQILYPAPADIKPFQSTIGSVNQANNKSVLAFCVNIVNKYKIPLFYQLLIRRRNKLLESKREINFYA